MSKKIDDATALVLLHAHREEFLGACEEQGMSDGDARELLADFEHDTLNEQEAAAC